LRKEVLRVQYKICFIENIKKNAVKDPHLFNKLKDSMNDCGVDDIVFNDSETSRYTSLRGDKTGRISLSEKDKDSADVLAHELGHAYHMNNPKSKLGKFLHKLDDKVNDKYQDIGITKAGKKGNKFSRDLADKYAWETKNKVGTTVSGISGIASGYLAEREKEKGHKGRGRLISAGAYLIPILGHAPELGKEASASSRGIKMMKAAGASKDQIRSAKKSLGYALGTYASGLPRHLLNTGAGQVAGRGIYKLTHKKKNLGEKKDKGEDK
jgi:hypothetical protein